MSVENCQSETTDAFGNYQSKGKMMRTLDEVIKALRCTDPETDPETKCEDCPYKELHIDEPWYAGPSCLDEMFADALHYLKEYQTLQYGYIKAMADLEDNSPLTWSELKQMEGKPVWVEQTMIFEEGTPEEYQQDVKEWMIISAIHNKQGWVDMVDVEDGELQFDRKDNTWKAYRKERK